jgi:hypothetical protein
LDDAKSTTDDVPKESNSIGSNAMMVEETENSSNFTQLTEMIVIFFSTCIPIWKSLKFILVNFAIL